MLVVVTILLLFITPLAMIIFLLARPKFGIQGFLLVLTSLAGWILVFISRDDFPKTVSLLVWEPFSFFPNSPMVLLDQTSWIFALGLMSLAVTLSITSITELGQSVRIPAPDTLSKVRAVETQALSVPVIHPGSSIPSQENNQSSRRQSWAGILLLTGCGLVAVAAGNMVTLVLGWALIDVIELVILISQVSTIKAHQRLIAAFSTRMASTAVALLAGIIPWTQGLSLSFDSINQSTSIYLIFAAVLRLGILPADAPVLDDIRLRRGFGTILRLVPAASGYILLVRLADTGVFGPGTPYLLGLTVLAGLYACARWINAKDELSGRPYWILGISTLAIGSAILNHPEACLAWCMAGLLSGGLIFSVSIQNKIFLLYLIIAVLALTGIPFSPTWQGTSLYTHNPSTEGIITTPIFYLLSFGFIIIHALLLVGYTRHFIRRIYPPQGQPTEHIERWVWLLYPFALLFILVTHFLFGILTQPDLQSVPITMWGAGVVTILISTLVGYFLSRFDRLALETDQQTQLSRAPVEVSFVWINRITRQISRVLFDGINLITGILEGDGGILWALVLFALIFIFLQR